MGNQFEIEDEANFKKELLVIQKEINIQRNLVHPNVVKLFDYFYVDSAE